MTPSPDRMCRSPAHPTRSSSARAMRPALAVRPAAPSTAAPAAERTAPPGSSKHDPEEGGCTAAFHEFPPSDDPPEYSFSLAHHPHAI